MISLSEWVDIVTIVGVTFGALSLVVTAQNVRLTKRTGRARFWLDLRDQFAKHDEVSRRLRPGGEWSGANVGPTTPGDWAQVEAYLALFELCEVLLQEKLVDEPTFKKLLGYRLEHIVANDTIRYTKLVEEAGGWEHLLNLMKRLEIKVQSTDS